MLDVGPARDLKTFLMLPESLYRDVPHWVPPLWRDEAKLLDRARHPFHRHAEVEYFLARRDGRPVGRVAAIVNRAHNDFHGDRLGFFGFFDCADDPEAARGLLAAAEAWLKERGRDASRGPCNFSTNETCGLLVEGFETPPYILTTYHPPYVARLVEGAGYAGVKDLLGYSLHRDHSVQERLRRIADIVRRRTNVTVRDVDLNRFDEELRAVQKVYNSAWGKNWGFVPMTPEEMELMGRDLRPVLVPWLCYLAEVEGRPVGFAMAVQDVNRILKQIRGRLFPLGWWKLLTGVKRVPTCRVVALGVRPEFQHSGLASLFCLRFLEQAPANGVPGGELSWILEDNVAMNKPLVEMGSRLYKRWRMYEKRISP